MKLITLVSLLFVYSFSYSQDWIKLNNGIPLPSAPFLTVEHHRNELLIIGTIFFDGNGNPLMGPAKWDGYNFDPYGNGLPYTPKSYHAFRYNDTLFVSSYLEVNGKYTLAYYDENLDTFISTNKILWGIAGSSLEVNDTLYLSGLFRKCGSDTTWGFCMFNGSQWQSLFSQGRDEGSSANFLDFIRYKGKIYVGGNFYLPDLDSNYIDDVAILENGELSSFGGGINFTGIGFTSAFAILNNELYIAGYFISANGMPVGHIVKWDGVQFSDVGGGADNYITDMIVYNNNLYISGYFSYVGGVYAPNIARWDGSQWHGFTYEEFPPGAGIEDMEIYNDELYITGNFATIGNETFNCMAKYRYKLPGQVGNNINVFINNNTEQLIVEFEESANYNLLVIVSAVNGQIVKTFLQKNLNGFIHTVIPIPELASGAYIVEVVAGNKTVQRKLLKL